MPSARSPLLLTAMLAVALMLAGCDALAPDSPATDAAGAADSPAVAAAAVPMDAADAQPLAVGATAPAAKLRDAQGQTVDLAEQYAARPTVLIFYRGGWCPYCTAHLAEVAKAEAKLIEMGLQVIAVSPDKPEKIAETPNKADFQYQILSDSDMALSQAFGLAFKVDDATIEKYKEYGIDLQAASGLDHHQLPVPAVYIVDTAGKIQFAHADPNYKERLAIGKLMAAAEAAVGSAGE